MDNALMKLDARLDEVRKVSPRLDVSGSEKRSAYVLRMDLKEFNEIESQVKPVLEASESGNESSEVYFLREKWKSTLEEWNGIQKDADVGICSISPSDLGSLIVAKYPTDARRRDERRQMASRIQ